MSRRSRTLSTDLGFLIELEAACKKAGADYNFWRSLAKVPDFCVTFAEAIAFCRNHAKDELLWELPKRGFELMGDPPMLHEALKNLENNGFRDDSWKELVEAQGLFSNVIAYLFCLPPYTLDFKAHFPEQALTEIPVQLRPEDTGAAAYLARGEVRRMALFPALQDQLADSERRMQQLGFKRADALDLLAYEHRTFGALRPWCVVGHRAIVASATITMGQDRSGDARLLCLADPAQGHGLHLEYARGAAREGLVLGSNYFLLGVQA